MRCGLSDVRASASLITIFDSQLTVPIVVGYQTARSRAVSKKLVAQKYFGSVLMTWTSTLRAGSTVPSGTASISTGRNPS